MIDINNVNQLERLKKAAISSNGKLIIDFLRQQLDDLSYDNLDDTQSDEKAGQDFKVIKKTRKFINNILSLLTPEKGD